MKTRAVHEITSAQAQDIIRAAADHAAAEGLAMVIAVVDRGGNLVALERMDGASIISIKVAQDKAYTAAAFGMTTAQWTDLLTQDEPLRIGAPSSFGNFCSVPGGFPLLADGEIVGGLGVSGGHHSQDVAVGEAGMGAVSG